MQLTVAICTYNPRPELLVRVIEAIAAQVDPADTQTELLLIDNNSSPSLVDAEYLKKYRLRVVRELRQGLTAARERTIAEAKGEIVLFVDDDNVLSPGYLKTALELFTSPRVGMIGGAVFPEYEEPPPAWIGRFEEYLALRRHPPNCHVETTEPPCTKYFPIGAGFGIRRHLAMSYVESLQDAGRIEGRKGGALSSGEDTDMALFVLSQGHSLVVDGRLHLIHVIAPARTQEQYMTRLAIGIIQGSVNIERKWRGKFGKDVIGLLSYPKWKLFVKLIVAKISSSLLASQRIRAAQLEALLNIRAEL